MADSANAQRWITDHGIVAIEDGVPVITYRHDGFKRRYPYMEIFMQEMCDEGTRWLMDVPVDLERYRDALISQAGMIDGDTISYMLRLYMINPGMMEYLHENEHISRWLSEEVFGSRIFWDLEYEISEIIKTVATADRQRMTGFVIRGLGGVKSPKDLLELHGKLEWFLTGLFMKRGGRKILQKFLGGIIKSENNATMNIRRTQTADRQIQGPKGGDDETLGGVVK